VIYREKRYIERDKTKFIRMKEKWNGGPADTCLKRDRTRGRASRTKSSSCAIANPREHTSSSARAEQRTTGIYIRVAARFIRGNLLPAGEEKERHEKELLTRSVRPYTKCTISPCSVIKKGRKNDDDIESRRRGYYIKQNILF